MPDSNTFNIKPIKQLIGRYIKSDMVIVDPFANSSKLGTITNDLNTNYDTDYHLNAVEFLKIFDDNSVDIALFDPPYSPRQIKECYDGIGLAVSQEDTQSKFWSDCKNQIKRILKTGGITICFGWNSMGCGMNRGFHMIEILLVPHGGNKNDTICTVETKSNYEIF